MTRSGRWINSTGCVRSPRLAWRRSSRARSRMQSPSAFRRILTTAMPRCCSRGSTPRTCPNQFTFGRDGKPFYVQVPNESFAQANAIGQRIEDAGGHYVIALPNPGSQAFPAIEGAFDRIDPLDEDDSPEESL